MLNCWPNTPQDYPKWSGFGRRIERQCGLPAAAAAGSIRRTHPCASTLSAITESRSVARPLHRQWPRGCGRVRSGIARCAARRQAAAGALERSARCRKRSTVGDRGALIDRLWPGAALKAPPWPGASPGRRSRERGRLGLAPSRRGALRPWPVFGSEDVRSNLKHDVLERFATGTIGRAGA